MSARLSPRARHRMLAPVVVGSLLSALPMPPSGALAAQAAQAPPAAGGAGERGTVSAKTRAAAERVKVQPIREQPPPQPVPAPIIVPEGERNPANTGTPPGGVAPPKADAQLLAVSADDDLSLGEWLNQQAEAGSYAISLVPVGPGRSLAVVQPGQPVRTTIYVVTTVIGAPDLEGITKRLAVNPGRAFVGLHVLGDDAYLLVLRGQ